MTAVATEDTYSSWCGQRLVLDSDLGELRDGAMGGQLTALKYPKRCAAMHILVGCSCRCAALFHSFLLRRMRVGAERVWMNDEVYCP